MKALYSVLLLAALTGGASGLFTRKYIHVAQSLSWTEAQTYCRNNYVDLMIIDTKEEYDDFLLDSAQYSSDRCWIGLTKGTTETAYTQWSDGSPLGFSKWYIGGPLNTDTEHCVTTIYGFWSDHGCTNVHNFYCYMWRPELVVVRELKTWNEALEHCRTFYIDLIRLKTKNDLLIANKNISDIQTTHFWTGLHFLDGSWIWINKNVPVNLPSLDSCPLFPYRCGAITGADRFENKDCSEKLFFICSK